MSGLKYVGIEGQLIELSESQYCPLYTSKDWPITWYKWLKFVPEKELEKIDTILEKPDELLSDEDKSVLYTFYERNRIAKLIYNQRELKKFTYKEQQEVLNFTKNNSLEEIKQEKLSYYNEEEKNKVLEKMLKKDEK